jgi:MIP family channel proteins
VLRPWFAELFGTFCLVFAGTGAIVVENHAGVHISHVGVSLTFGLIVLVMIQTLGDVSGCHLNPAVTIAFAVAKRFDWKKVPLYISAQLLGAVIASFVLRIMFLDYPTLGETMPKGGEGRSWTMELILSMILMVVILSVSSGSKEKGLLAGLAIGATVALEALFAGPVSGASMNPARSFAPAFMTGRWQSQWIYLTAPVCGTLLGVLVCSLIHQPGQCCRIEPSVVEKS